MHQLVDQIISAGIVDDIAGPVASIHELTIKEAFCFFCRKLKPTEKWVVHNSSKEEMSFTALCGVLVNYHLSTQKIPEWVFEDYATDELKITGVVRQAFVNNALSGGRSILYSPSEQQRFESWYYTTILLASPDANIV